MAGRHGNGEGTIYKRTDGRWEAKIALPDGRRKSFYYPTRQEAARRLAEATRDRDKGLPIVAEAQTVAAFAASWLETVKPTVKASTWRSYEHRLRVYLVPTLGRVRLARLTPQHLQELYARKLEDGLSTTTVNHLHAIVHKMLEQAMRWGVLLRNVADLVDPPRIAEHEIRPFTLDQARALLAAARGDRWEAFYVLALHTGMRLGELLGLRWRDVDLARGSLQVRGSLQPAPIGEAGLVIGSPKTPRARRKIALTDAARAALLAHRARQHEERLWLGAAWQDHDLVFPSTIGTAADPMHVLRRQFYPLLTRAGLPRARLHDLRHTAATLMLSDGVNVKVVSEMLGHADVSTTLRIYAHVLPDMQASAKAAIDRLYG